LQAQSGNNMIDILKKNYGENTPEKKILDKGHVRLVDIMPRLVPDGQTCDQAIVQAARVSYGQGTKQVNEDRGLIRYLMRHSHTTPFEMVDLKWHVKMPLFVCRQWIRHRTVSVNEVSGRYSVLKDEFFSPEISTVRLQSKTNKQGSEQPIEPVDAADFIHSLDELSRTAYQKYEEAIAKGIGKEQARLYLPVNLYTELYWKINLHNLLHFLKLRCDSHAQYEIRVFADAMLEMIRPLVPWTIEAWEDYSPYRKAETFSRLEIEKLKSFIALGRVRGRWTSEALQTIIDRKDAPLWIREELQNIVEDLSQQTTNCLASGNKREDTEWEEKMKKLGIA
jgi:thymidylate synthase (FAD)